MASGKRKTLKLFYEEGEPYSELLLDVMPGLARAYNVGFELRPVGPPETSAAPEPEMLAAWSRRDADALRQAYRIPRSLYSVESVGELDENARWRQAHGHYGSGMVWFEGEWYWGIDRLHHLERRLGAREGELVFTPLAEPEGPTGGSFDVFFSLRSPYSYIAMMRAPELAKRWQAELVLKPVLPMVMRSLPVPRQKQFYIVRDVKREAERYGLPFGKISDPVGAGVERGLAILHQAIPDGKGIAFTQSFYTAVWSEGVDAARDSGLRKIVERAGIDWSFAEAAMADESWRQAVDANRQEMFALGHWGVPTFRVAKRAAFGQDRLWQVGRWLEESAA
jgi:2-hydroxychromene-2-carboxylate isomerase